MNYRSYVISSYYINYYMKYFGEFLTVSLSASCLLCLAVSLSCPQFINSWLTGALICSGKLVLYNNYQIEKEDFWKSSFLMNYLYKNAGFIILLTSIFILFYFGEIRILIIFIRLMDYNNSFSIIFLLFIFLLFLWIGAQFPLEKFLSYGRILIFYYYHQEVIKQISSLNYISFFSVFWFSWLITFCHLPVGLLPSVHH